VPAVFYSRILGSRTSDTIFCYRLSKPQGLVWLEGLGNVEKINDLIGSRTRDHPACSIEPQPTTLPLPPSSLYKSKRIFDKSCECRTVMF
jgi:hypothetical protein